MVQGGRVCIETVQRADEVISNASDDTLHAESVSMLVRGEGAGWTSDCGTEVREWKQSCAMLATRGSFFYFEPDPEALLLSDDL